MQKAAMPMPAQLSSIDIDKAFPRNFILLPGFVENLNTVWEDHLQTAQRKLLRKGERLLFAAGSSFAFFYIRKGLIATNISSPSGEEMTTFFHGKGCIAGISYFLVDVDPSPRSFVAMEDSEIFLFPKTTFNKETLISQYPDLLLNITIASSIKILSDNSLVYILGRMRASAKVASFILSMYEFNNRKNEFENKLFSYGIASLLGMHKITFSKIISELKEKNILKSFSKNIISISDVEELKRQAHGEG